MVLLSLLKISLISSLLLVITRLQQIYSLFIYLKINYITFDLLNKLVNSLDVKFLKL